MAGLPADDYDRRVAGRLSEWRKSRNLTQRQVAASMGVSAAQVQKYEKGVNCLSVSALHKICKMFQVSPMTFFDEDVVDVVRPSGRARRRALTHIDKARELLTPSQR